MNEKKHMVNILSFVNIKQDINPPKKKNSNLRQILHFGSHVTTFVETEIVT